MAKKRRDPLPGEIASAKCAHCLKEFVRGPYNPSAKYCSDKCQKAGYYKSNYLVSPYKSSLIAGEINEHRVVIDLLEKGFHLFKPLGFGCGFDYLALKDETMHRVEVRTGSRNKNTGRVRCNPGRYRNGYTVLAIVLGDQTIIYRDEKGDDICVSEK